METADLGTAGKIGIVNIVDHEDGGCTITFEVDERFKRWFKIDQKLKRWSNKRFEKWMTAVLEEGVRKYDEEGNVTEIEIGDIDVG